MPRDYLTCVAATSSAVCTKEASAFDRCCSGQASNTGASVTVQYAKELLPEGIVVNAINPGACATDFTAALGLTLERTAADGARIIVNLATMGRDSPTGGVFDDDGPVPW